jgi:hypothetical protein
MAMTFLGKMYLEGGEGVAQSNETVLKKAWVTPWDSQVLAKLLYLL